MAEEVANDRTAVFVLEALRWPHGVICPRCEAGAPYRMKRGGIYRCRGCRFEFTVTTGSVFDKHKLTTKQIVNAILWHEDCEGGGSTADLARQIGVTWKTAHVMRMRIWEFHVGGLNELSVLARGYWQGFNNWMIGDDGSLVRSHSDGRSRTV